MCFKRLIALFTKKPQDIIKEPKKAKRAKPFKKLTRKDCAYMQVFFNLPAEQQISLVDKHRNKRRLRWQQSTQVILSSVREYICNPSEHAVDIIKRYQLSDPDFYKLVRFIQYIIYAEHLI